MRTLCAFVLVSLAIGATQAQPVETFKSGVTMIQVPVVVRDRAGHAVANLEKQDFQLFDNGKPVEIASFALEKPGSQAIPDRSLPDPNGPKPAGQAMDIPEHFIAYVFDDRSWGFGILTRLRDAATKQLSELAPGDRASIVTTSCAIMQDFTNDRAKLLEALSHLQIMPPQVCQFSPARVLQLEVLKQVVKRMENLPGRREILLVSGGFLPGPSRWNQPADLIDAAVRAKVVINTLDHGGATEHAGPASGGASVGANSSLERLQSSEPAAVRPLALVDLARGTGGTYVTGNDYDLNFRRLSTPECHYALAFVSTAKTDGKFHQLRVKVDKKGKYMIEARNGYYAPERAE